MKIVVYTCITNGYDPLIEPSAVDPEIDYLAFVNNTKVTSSIWKICRIKVDSDLGPVKTARKIKILGHKYLKDYDYNVWVDGNVDVVGDVRDLIKLYNNPELLLFKHRDRQCIYAEGRACIKQLRDNNNVILNQLLRYYKEGYPKNNGLVATGVIIRKQQSSSLNSLMLNWWREVKENSRRDQLSFNYSIWKAGMTFSVINEGFLRDSNGYFSVRDRHAPNKTFIWWMKRKFMKLNNILFWTLNRIRIENKYRFL